ncbi:hypothetical protein ADM96_01705 [Burkholderia sp. ST111]|nr:hypothetical protein ADM96_01705 [Burkholderia sp. ST111]
MRLGALVSLSFGVVVRETTLALALIPLVLSLLTACTADVPRNSNEPLMPSADNVAKRCLAQAAGSGAPLLTVGEMNALQWRHYVSCALSSNMFVDANGGLGNPEAIVSLRLNIDGSVGSVMLLHTSGNEAWDAPYDVRLPSLRRYRQRRPIKTCRASNSISGHGIARSELAAAQESREKAIGQSSIA